MLTPEQIAQMDKLSGIQTASSTSKRGSDRFAELESMTAKIPNTKDRSTLKDLSIGALKGVGQTYENMSNLGQSIAEKTLGEILPASYTNATREIFNQTPEDQQRADEFLAADNTAQEIGKAAEQVAEFFVPELSGLKMAKAPGAVNLARRVAGEGLGTGAVTLAQTGDPKEAVQGGAVGAVLPVAGKTLDLVKNEKNAGRMINSLIKTKQMDFSFGKNPGKTVAEEGIVGNSLDDLIENIRVRKDEIGNDIGAIVKKATEQGKKVNIFEAFKPLDDAIAKAKKAELTNAPLIKKLEDLKVDLMKGKKLEDLSPEEAFNIKQTVAELTRFTGNPSDDKAANAALTSVYSNIKNAINNAVGDKRLAELNDKYGNLVTALKAGEKRSDALQGQNLTSLGSKATGAAATFISLLSGGAATPAILTGLAAGGGVKLLSSTPVKTRVAKWLASKSDEEKAVIFKAAPYLKGLVITNLVED